MPFSKLSLPQLERLLLGRSINQLGRKARHAILPVKLRAMAANISSISTSGSVSASAMSRSA